uniref:Uncharacterized protein n=1 Tax=Oryza meridionalis TaxID=40149 RepID=A0A0E0DQG7_9ORYZ
MAMPRSKKIGAEWAKTRRNPRSAATRNPSSSGNVLLALRSATQEGAGRWAAAAAAEVRCSPERREPKPTTDTRPRPPPPRGAVTAAKWSTEFISGKEPPLPVAAAEGEEAMRRRRWVGSGDRRRRRRGAERGRVGRWVRRSGPLDFDRTARGGPGRSVEADAATPRIILV